MIYSSSDLLLISDILDMQIALNTSINGSSYVSFSILSMIYQYFWRARLAKKWVRMRRLKI